MIVAIIAIGFDPSRSSLPAAAEHRGELRHARHHHDGRRDRRRHRADQDVAMLHVRQLVRDDPFELLIVQQPHDPFRRRNRGVARIAPCRKRVRRRVRNDVDLRHRKAGLRREPARHDRQRMIRPDFLGAVHLQHDLVREPVGDEVHDDRKTERHHETLRAAEQLADREQEPAQQTQQQDCFQRVVHMVV